MAVVASSPGMSRATRSVLTIRPTMSPANRSIAEFASLGHDSCSGIRLGFPREREAMTGIDAINKLHSMDSKPRNHR